MRAPRKPPASSSRVTPRLRNSPLTTSGMYRNKTNLQFIMMSPLGPLRKWIGRAPLHCQQQIPHPFPSLDHTRVQTLQLSLREVPCLRALVTAPSARHVEKESLDHARIHLFDARQPGLKAIPTGYVFVDAPP